MPGRPVINIPPEKTQVSPESEVTTPRLTATWGAIFGDIAILSVFLFWASGLLWREGFRVTGEWIAAWWGAWLQALMVPWFLISSALFVSFLIQTIDKHWPATRKSKDADASIISGIFGKRRERQDREGDDNENEW